MGASSFGRGGNFSIDVSWVQGWIAGGLGGRDEGKGGREATWVTGLGMDMDGDGGLEEGRDGVGDGGGVERGVQG